VPTEAPPKASSVRFPIVALGSSAGGLQALKAFFDLMPSDSGLAFICISHLDPTQESHLAELLARRTSMRVQQATDKIEIRPNQVYIIPPNAKLLVTEGRLRVTRPVQARGLRRPIDDFFRSVAQYAGPRAIGIVLSGTGDDGTSGVRAITEAGGIAIAQSSENAEYADMPKNAVASGVVDFELPVSQMPERVLYYAEHLRAIDASNEDEQLELAQAELLSRVLPIMRAQIGQDFRGYKETTLLRRIQRRMHLAHLTDPDQYIAFLSNTPDEAQRLFQDLLIGVTRFFRDSEVFEKIQTLVMPTLLQTASGESELRIWVPGCSTGEEAYSLAMIGVECAQAQEGPTPRIQIFATDIDDAAIEVARRGVYNERISEVVSKQRLARFFEHGNGEWRANKVLRERIVFAVHDVIRDPPFSRLDLISCRNLLIYFDTDVQRRIMNLFHYALRHCGWLVLGPSEGTTSAEAQFEPVDRQKRIFRARPKAALAHATLPATGDGTGRGTRFVPTTRSISDFATTRAVERLVLDALAAPCAVVDSDNRALYFTGTTTPFLEIPRGSASLDILDLARPGLRSELRRLLHVTAKAPREVAGREVKVVHEDRTHLTRLRIKPLEARAFPDGLRLVIFEPLASDPSANDQVSQPTHREYDESAISHLEEELAITRQALEATVEQLETSNEELRASNEEFMSTNEELQSTVEELETSKEELQSMNEELETVNAELRATVEDTDRTNGDLQNLLRSTHIATLFLDRELRIRSFTPASMQLFRLIEEDRGRSVSDLARHFEHPSFEADVQSVLETLEPISAEIRTRDGRCFTMRVFPYRTLEGEFDGAVVTFNDTTALVSAADEVAALNRRLQFRLEERELTFELAPIGMMMCEVPGTGALRLNRHALAICGVDRGAELCLDPARPLPFQFEADGRELPIAELPISTALATGRTEAPHELTLVRADGTRREVRFAAAPLLGEGEQVRVVIASLADITDSKQQARELSDRARRQTILSELGVKALGELDLGRIQHEVVRRLAAALEVPMCQLLEREEGGTFRLVAGVGWQPGSVGQAEIPASRASHAGSVLDRGRALVVEDSEHEERLRFSPLLERHGARSGVAVLVGLGEHAWGVLGVHTTEPRRYSRDEVQFVQSAANILAIAIERARSEQELARSRQRLDQARAEERLAQAERLASLGAMAGAIAHEINNPMNNILMNAELAQLLLESDEARGEILAALARVVEGARRCGQITESVLGFSRASGGSTQTIELHEFLTRILATHEMRDRIHCELDGELCISATGEGLERIFDNLFRNAREAGATGIWIRGACDGDHVQIAVDDDGPGIPPEIRNRLFDPFFSTRRSEGGTGLGLSLVDGIVRNLKGRVSTARSPEGGARFRILFPRVRETPVTEDA